ncbi:MAG: hypothetical protein GTO02_10305, partial [Candidatus Dadabacteria bacterium]|nr:hypothetical protein [Candidatus Dadabacteria bacterium]
MDEDFFVDDSFLMPKKKKINTGRKGKNRERETAKILNERFGGGFSRSIGSGNRIHQVANLPKHAQDTFSGDLVTPENFAFTIESKGGYDDVDLVSVFDDGHSQLNDFLKQAQHDADRCNRKPMVVWKKNYKPELAILRTKDLPHMKWSYRLIYNKWSVV